MILWHAHEILMPFRMLARQAEKVMQAEKGTRLDCRACRLQQEHA